MENLLTLSEPWHAAMPKTSPSSSNMTQYLSLWLELGEFSVPVTRRVQIYALRTGQQMFSLAGPSYPRAVAMLFAQRYVFSNHGRHRRIHDNVCLNSLRVEGCWVNFSCRLCSPSSTATEPFPRGSLQSWEQESPG